MLDVEFFRSSHLYKALVQDIVQQCTAFCFDRPVGIKLKESASTDCLLGLWHCKVNENGRCPELTCGLVPL